MHVRSTKKVAGRTVAMASLSPSSRLSQNSDIPLPPSRAPIPTVELTSQDRICIQFASLATLRSARSLGHNETIRLVAKKPYLINHRGIARSQSTARIENSRKIGKNEFPSDPMSALRYH